MMGFALNKKTECHFKYSGLQTGQAGLGTLCPTSN